MKQQVVIIGGGDTFIRHNDYISNLKNKDITLDKLRPKRDWKDTFADQLGENFDVLYPKMPNTANARFVEWKIWFERIATLLDDNPILIGHSLGGIFLAKYLSEKVFSKSIRATVIIAPPYQDATSKVSDKESMASFTLPSSLTRFEKQSGVIYLIHSQDDPVVPFEQLEKYKLALPNANTLIFKDRGHFKQESFPELVKLLGDLAA